ncbi:DUF1524 domain-containing protein [Allobranchiibius sp. GilTou38]|uniref:GmrSD restriction endonuclease domain-containing protein n=1 Tax=Allobranchiibius sp. GilTou38 TaxID=2815210 RepID=UPI001FB5AD0E|nr:DUF1524 domain-containing protein [Allobranchiibius sp. GilTou38]
MLLTALIGLASSGVSGLFSLAGVYVLVVGVVALVRGRVRWALLRNRAMSGIAIAGAIVGLVVGGATAKNPSTTPVAGHSPSSTIKTTAGASLSATPTAAASTTPPTTPTAKSNSSALSSSSTHSSSSTAAQNPAKAIVGSNPAAHAALATLATLQVKGRAPQTGYDRAQFGQAWTDDVTVADGHNGCDTRNDILGRDLAATSFKAGTNNCAVTSGTLHDLYTGRTISFIRGDSTSTAVQIDHIVSLSDAWQTGAQQLSAEQRQNFANDPRELLAVDGPTNEAKGDGDAATWLPPNKSFRCTYVADQVMVKSAYRLWVTSAEKAAMTAVLTHCSNPPAATPSPSSTHTPSPSTTYTSPLPLVPTTTAPQPADVYYANCAAARAAGAAPLYRGQPGYRSGLDRDDDGVACE